MLARGAVYTMLSRVAFILSGYAIHFSMAYLLTPADYGKLGVIIGLITLWRVFLSAGLPQTASQFIAGDDEGAYGIWRQALKIQMTAALVLWAVYVLGTPLWSRLLSDTSLGLDILISSLLIPFMAWYQINLGYYIGRLQLERQAFYATLYAFARVVLAVILAVVGLKIHGAVAGMTLAVLLVAVVTHAGVPKRAGPLLDPPHWRRLAGFSLPLIAISLGISALLNLDLLMLQRYYPESEMVGFYNAAVNLGKSPYFLLATFSTTVLPSVSKALKEGNEAGAQRLVAQHNSYVLLLSLPVAALVVASGAQLLDLVYPAKYVVAAPALAILIFSMSGLSLINVLTSAVTAAGKPRVAMLVVLACVGLQVTLGSLLIPRFGMIGTATANALTVLFGVVACSWSVKKIFGAVLELGRVLKATFASAIIGGLFVLLPHYPLMALPFLYAVALAIFAGLMFALGGVTASERALLHKLLRRLGLAKAAQI